MAPESVTLDFVLTEGIGDEDGPLVGGVSGSMVCRGANSLAVTVWTRKPGSRAPSSCAGGSDRPQPGSDHHRPQTLTTWVIGGSRRPARKGISRRNPPNCRAALSWEEGATTFS
jgi:hypothetical protein